jgi:magnesium transporter
MPIVASLGGNAATQTLTVIVRGLATRELTAANALRVLGKEALVGQLNGLLLAVIGGLGVLTWFGYPDLGLVFAGGILINVLVATLVGVCVPLLLNRLKVDPAVASPVFVTTLTDAVGFFSFLGLATWFLLG